MRTLRNGYKNMNRKRLTGWEAIRIVRSRCRRNRRDAQAEVAELVDALGSGLSWGNPVEVQVLSSAPDYKKARPKAGPSLFSPPQAENGFRSTIVSARSGPVEIASTGVPVNSSIRRR